MVILRKNRPKYSEKPLIKLDIACGQNKKEGFKGIDIARIPGVDIVHDLRSYPWPIKNESVEEAHCSHFLEHVPGLERPRFFEELYRILIPGGKCQVICPYWSSPRAVQDWSHQWPPISEETFLYFNQDWVKQNKLDHGQYLIKANFNFSWGSAIGPEWAQRQDEARAFAVRNYIRSVIDIFVTLEKIPLLVRIDETAAGKNGAMLKK